MRILTRNHIFYFGFLNKFIKKILFFFPFWLLEYSINPSTIIWRQHILRLIILIVICTLSDRFLTFFLILVKSSFNSHRLFYVSFRKFRNFFFDFRMHTIIKYMFSHPSKQLLKKPNRLSLSNRSNWSTQQRKIFAKLLQHFQLFGSIIVDQFFQEC